MTMTATSTDTGEPSPMTQGYRPLPGVYDEMMTAEGSVRPHWRGFLATLESLAEPELDARLRKATRLLDENGWTYKLATSAEGTERPWQLDFVPVVLTTQEWEHLERGLTQRATLLNGILADLLGPQRLIREGHLPAALVYANPHFLRPCTGIAPRDGVFLHFYAADLGRGPEGQWWVLSDRTQAPAGAGYALENRNVLSRSLRELFRGHHVRRLADFFQAFHESLIARTGLADPRLVLLSGGPAADRFFDHAYLAHHLGYTLAGSEDLTVRSRRLFLKTVDGLKPVDLVLRMLASEACDPLEFDHPSGLGVAGLVDAARGGAVTVANALGSGVVETRALMGFLPSLCRLLLDQDLILPNAATWWCGQDDALDHVLENIDHLAVDLAYDRQPLLEDSDGPVIVADLQAHARTGLVEAIRHRSHAFVGVEPVILSTTPVWLEGRLQPRPMSIRAFLSAADGDYAVMPGGLARVAASTDARAFVLRRGSGTKDTLVLADDPFTAVHMPRRSREDSSPRRTAKDIPSHSADNLFWLGRFAERLDGTMRVLRSVLRRIAEGLDMADELAAVDRVVDVLYVPADGAAPCGPAAVSMDSLEQRVRSLVFLPGHENGVQDILETLFRTATAARDWLSVEAWRTLSGFHIDARRPPLADGLDVSEALERVDEAIRMLAAFSGLEMENMTRDHGWRFLDMGRRLERARLLSRLLRRSLVSGEPGEDGSLLLMLEIADSIMTYRWRYLSTPKLGPVLDLLLLDETNPRSVAFQLCALERHVEDLPRDVIPPARSAEQRLILKLATAVRLAEIPVLLRHDDRGSRSGLADLLDTVESGLPALSDALTARYFSHAQARRPVDQIVESEPE